MALVVIDPASVFYVSGSIFTYDAGVGITAGKLIYPDSGNKWQLANDSMSVVPYMALNDGQANQPVTAVSRGIIEIGVTLTQGILYYLGSGDGLIYDDSSLTIAGDYLTIVGYMDTIATQLVISPYLVPYPLV